jgi:hypothetical protein
MRQHTTHLDPEKPYDAFGQQELWDMVIAIDCNGLDDLPKQEQEFIGSLFEDFANFKLDKAQARAIKDIHRVRVVACEPALL